VRRIFSFLGSILAQFAYVVGVRKAVTLDNLALAFPELSSAKIHTIARRSFANLGKVFLEMVYLRFAPKRSVSGGIQLINPEDVLATEGLGRGVILLSGHLANWEWMGLGMGLGLKRDLGIIVKNQKGNFSERFLNTMRARFGNRIINAGDVRAVFQALQNNELVALLGDQAAPDNSIRVPFFGREVPTFEGAARFALRTRAALFVVECRRIPSGNYEIMFHPLDYSDLTGATEPEVKVLTARHTAQLERIIRARPDQWLWQHKRWKHVV
jgi:KDO2-lipid IV(A) lauroyltransferase